MERIKIARPTLIKVVKNVAYLDRAVILVALYAHLAAGGEVVWLWQVAGQSIVFHGI